MLISPASFPSPSPRKYSSPHSRISLYTLHHAALPTIIFSASNLACGMSRIPQSLLLFLLCAYLLPTIQPVTSLSFKRFRNRPGPLAYFLQNRLRPSPLPTHTPYPVPKCPLLAIDLIRFQYNKFALLLRRGVPNIIVQPVFNLFVRAVIERVKIIHPSAFSLATACVSTTPEASIPLESFMKLVYRVIELARIKDCNLFFLSPLSYPSPSLHIERVHAMVDETWNASVILLSIPLISPIKPRLIFPRTVHFFFDPRKDAVQKNFFQHAAVPISDFVSAPDLLYAVTAMVLRLQLVGVSSDKALQILRHCVAFIGNACRATRLESYQLLIPNVFLPFYHSAIVNLTESVPESSSHVYVSTVKVMVRLHRALKVLSTYESWGRLDHTVYDDVLNIKITLPELLAHKDVLSYVRHNPHPWQALTRTYTTKKQPLNLNGPVVRMALICKPGFFKYMFDLTTSVCCASICKNISLIKTVGVTTKRECCNYCTMSKCLLDARNPISKLSTVVFEEYGLTERTVLNVLL